MRTFVRRSLVALGLVAAALAGGIAHVRTSLPEAPDLGPAATGNPALVARGEYLFKSVAVCADCHSERDFGHFAGPMVDGTLGRGGQTFGPELGLPGTLHAKNITPAGVGDWSDAELARAIFAGVSRDGEPLFPLMPYLSYGQMCEDDARSVLAYVRTLAPVENDVPERALDFPVSALVWTMPTEARFAPCPDRADPVATGEYLVRMASCQDCHTPMEQGTPIAGRELSGGVAITFPNGAVVRTANITPDDETGIGRWTADDFVARFRTMAQHASDPADPNGFNTPMPWPFYGTMAEEDLRAIYAFLRTVPAVRNPMERFTPPPAGARVAVR